MTFTKTNIDGVLLIKPRVHSDERGDFRESYQEKLYKAAGVDCDFVQDNLVNSTQGVFRGLHFQLPPYEQAKLITVISGEIIDIALDLRKTSSTFMQYVKIHLKKDEQLFVPTGFAHAYYVLSENATISYKVSAPYAPDHQSGIRWDDPKLDLKTQIKNPLISKQDNNWPNID